MSRNQHRESVEVQALAGSLFSHDDLRIPGQNLVAVPEERGYKINIGREVGVCLKTIASGPTMQDGVRRDKDGFAIFE